MLYVRNSDPHKDSHGRISYREFISYPSTAYAGNNTLCEINSYTSAEIH